MEKKASQDRASLLADVAEMYYLEEKNQTDISKIVGVTRSMVSRMLKEARESGLVDVRIHRPLQADAELENALKEQFVLKDVFVVATQQHSGERLTRILGSAGAHMLVRYLKPEGTLGLAWGSTISATVDAIEIKGPLPMKVVQLVGAMGAHIMEYDGHNLVSRLSERLGGEAYHLNAPFLCQNPEIAKSLLETNSIKETITLGKKADVALLGIGSTAPEYSSFYLAGYVALQDLDTLRNAGAVGDVCGLHFDIYGRAACDDFCNRLVSINRDDLLSIPTRLAVAGSEGKADAILGALRSQYINILVTDSLTAKKVLSLAASSKEDINDQ